MDSPNEGRNKIVLCPAEMIRAVQHYFATVLFKPSSCPKVESVSQDNGIGGGVFVIEARLRTDR